MRALNPRLVYCSLWAFGHKGPRHLKPGYEPMIQAFAGMFSLNGQEGGPPTRVGMQVLDLGTGVWAALGTIAALLEREKTGQGCTVDTSLYETALGWLSVHFAAFQATGVPPTRHGSGNPRVVVFQSFVTADGEIVVAAANDRLFRKYVTELGHPEWGEDARFLTNALRVANKPAIIPPIARVMLEDTTSAWMTRLERVGVPCAPINDLHDVVERSASRSPGPAAANPRRRPDLGGAADQSRRHPPRGANPGSAARRAQRGARRTHRSGAELNPFATGGPRGSGLIVRATAAISRSGGGTDV